MQCYLCGSNETPRIIHKGVRGASGINVLKCESCGLVYLDQFIEDIDAFYAKSSMWDSNYLNNDVEYVRKLYDYEDNRRLRMTRGQIENREVLDFGCGSGGYIKIASRIAKKVDGVELEESMRKRLLEEGYDCFESLDKAKEANRQYDIITLFGVLEHLEDPIGMLRGLMDLLNDEGRIIIEVPNANEALLSRYKCEAFADFTYWICHLWSFTNDTLSKVIKLAGYEIDSLFQIQHYPLSNHLYWLSKGKPGGHNIWSFSDDDILNREYGQMLSKQGIADRIIAYIKRQNL